MKVALYTTTELMADPGSDTRYAYEGLKRHFDVAVYHESDPRLCHDADVVFSRFSLPRKPSFVAGLAEYSDKLVINDPRAQLRYGTKRTLLDFPGLTAPTLISESIPALKKFAARHGTVVIKPVDAQKGEDIRRIDAHELSDADLEARLRGFVTRRGTSVLQAFIDGVEAIGDKRINIFGFEPISAVVTFPAEGSFICHESSGGRAFAAEINDSDRAILEVVIPFLKEHNVWWAGVDIIGPYLGEINIMNPSMIERADRLHGTRAGIETVVRKLLEYQEDGGSNRKLQRESEPRG